MRRRVPFLLRVFEYSLISEITGTLMAKSGLTANPGQTKVLSYGSPTSGTFAIQRRMPLSPNIISGLAPTGVLRAGVNLSNFLLVTKINRQGIFVVEQPASRRRLTAVRAVLRQHYGWPQPLSRIACNRCVVLCASTDKAQPMQCPGGIRCSRLQITERGGAIRMGSPLSANLRISTPTGCLQK
jgi:hypothetical protein